MTHIRTVALVLALALVPLACQTAKPLVALEHSEGIVIRPGVEPDSLEGLSRWVRHFWERRTQFREENGALTAAERTAVLLGDSLTEGWKHGDRVERFLPEGPIYLNRGITSDHILGDEIGLLRRMDESVFGCQPSHIFFVMGVNDLGRTWRTEGDPPVERVFAGYQMAVDAMLERCPQAKLCLVTTTPVAGQYEGITPHILEYNALVRALAEQRNLPLIDLFALLADDENHMPADLSGDGLHFNDEGFRIYGDEIGRVLRGTDAAGL